MIQLTLNQNLVDLMYSMLLQNMLTFMRLFCKSITWKVSKNDLMLHELILH